MVLGLLCFRASLALAFLKLITRIPLFVGMRRALAPGLKPVQNGISALRAHALRW
jgi:hypothetical protein